MKKIFTLATAILASFSLWATPVENLNFEITNETTAVPEAYTYSASNKPSIKTQNSITCIIISDGGGSTAPTFNDPDEPSGGKRWMAFSPDVECTAVFSVMSNRKKFYIQNKDGEFFSYTNTANAIEEVTVENLKAGEWYALCGASSQVYITKAVFTASCKKPEKELVLKADKEALIYVGDEVTFTTEGGNSNTPVIAGDAGEEINAGKWIATEGKHTFTAAQEAEGEICAQEAVLELTVLTKNPVVSAEVTGPANCYVGTKVTLTCTAANATAYQWYNKEGIIADATADTYEFTPEAAGEYEFYCTASNEFNAEPARSNSFVVTVEEKGKVEGLIIKATANQEVSGPGAGTVDTKISKAAEIKLNKGNYFGVQLADGFAFAEGDIFVISITTAADLGKCMLFADKAGTELIYNEDIEYSKESPSETGEKQIVLPAAVAGKTSLYLYRTESIQWNPTFNYIAVYRGDIPSAIENTEASVKAVKVIRDGQLYIMHNGRTYNVQGAVVR